MSRDALVKSGLTKESVDNVSSLISNTIEECDTYPKVAANHKKFNICLGLFVTFAGTSTTVFCLHVFYFVCLLECKD